MKLRLFPLLYALVISPCASAQTGTAVPALAEFDRQIQLLLDKWKLDGAAVAVVRSDKLLFARGYGVADPATGAPVQPNSLFRLNNTTVPATAATVLMLAEQGLISLDRPVFPLLGLGSPVDPRVDKITARNLLEHASGWDPSKTFEPLFDIRRVANEMGSASPPDTDTLLRWALRQPLQFEPGTASAISSLNYPVLGALIAKVTGQRYEDAVRTTLLGAGITRMRLAVTLRAGRAVGEVAYRDEGPARPSVFDSVPGQVPYPYGGFALEPFGPFLGWIGSVIDLAALGAAMNGQSTRERPDLLTSAQVADMLAKPSFTPNGTGQWRGKGWTVNSNAAFVGGSLPGSHARMLNRSDGATWAVVFNSLPSSSAFLTEVDVAMQAAVASVSRWPTDDAFPALLGAGPIAGCYGLPSFSAGKLCIPVVTVPNGNETLRFTAVLDLVDAANFTFRLSSAIPALGESDAVASFEPATGTVNLPRVMLPDANGSPQAYSVQLSVVPGGASPSFRLSRATLLPG